MVLYCRQEYFNFLVIPAFFTQGRVETIISPTGMELQGFSQTDSRENGWQFFY